MPAMTHACAESRQVVFEKYRVNIAMYDGDCGWIDPNEDIIYFSKGNEFIPASENFSTDALESIRTIAIDDCSWPDDGFDFRFDVELFSAVEKIMINQIDAELYDDSDEEYDDDIYYDDYYHGRCHKEHYKPSLVDITMTPRSYQDWEYLEMIGDHLYQIEFERMKDTLEDEEDEDDYWACGLSIPEIQIVNVERKERKPHRKYWGF
jgi:hypothetical protein